MHFFDRQLKYHMSGFHSYEGYGIEFYKKEVMEHLDWYFMLIGVNYSKLSPEEISELQRKVYRKINQNVVENAQQIQQYTPRDYQKEIIKRSVHFFFTCK